jgi:hypothetical protein
LGFSVQYLKPFSAVLLGKISHSVGGKVLSWLDQHLWKVELSILNMHRITHWRSIGKINDSDHAARNVTRSIIAVWELLTWSYSPLLKIEGYEDISYFPRKIRRHLFRHLWADQFVLQPLSVITQTPAYWPNLYSFNHQPPRYWANLLCFLYPVVLWEDHLILYGYIILNFILPKNALCSVMCIFISGRLLSLKHS